MMIGLALTLQIVKAIDRQSMKRNQLCFPRRAVIASSPMPPLKYLRRSSLSSPFQRARPELVKHLARKNGTSDPRISSRRMHSSIIADQLTSFMLASNATMQVHFIDRLAITDVESRRRSHADVHIAPQSSTIGHAANEWCH
ncbi:MULTISPECIES: hypothetical protein [unclassified Bradyrhizobium]|uniref:hypothetical protein n=1 Tax=unclassified Bradyrhizobium TaxID=2631580 RepID=UPI001BAC266F|nr:MULTISPECIES: hypothetical protein [unclassified Bradyrhizobium]MBR1203749.1 hypothetical protein [Bradyrhizobium sp. AUGA SZCCT0124]MBR1310364.1 hypothetical protein [Bradyrhizobium sp. AUGA SZCCT0051]MBR1340507.1 hypothetical protein [Bradyrhizobium sp. AUGA SZCCT0105]MBR1355113.1 hypothetical protein [Bradyrhizobium sp. AUGA SZCCT0045]